MKNVEIFENERATGYNDFVETWIPNYHYFINNLPKLLNEAKNKKLLIVGCGTGNEIECFVKDSEEWQITGIDPSPQMIGQAIKKFNNLNQVSLIQGVVSDLDIASTKYEVATLLLVLHFLEDDGTKLSLLKDISERLESGAPFIMLDITGNKTQLNDNLDILKLLLPDNLEKEIVEKRIYRIKNDLKIISEKRLSQLLVEAGFETPTRFFQSSIYMGWSTRKK